MDYGLERKYKLSGAIVILIYILLSILQIWQVNGSTGIAKTIFKDYRLMLLLWLFSILIYFRFIPKVHSDGRYTQFEKINFEALIFAIGYYLLRYLIGIIIYELGKSPYSFTPSGMINNILNVVPQLIVQELVRFQLINTYCKNSKKPYIFYGLSILLVACTFNWNLTKSIKDFESLTTILAKNLLPAICQSILLSFFSLYGSIASSIIYVITSFVFQWLVPVLPNINWFSEGVIGTIVPLLYISYITSKHNRKSIREKKKNIKEQVETGIMLTFSVLLIWFVVGVFPIYPSVIATGSMEPLIYPGDIILVNQIRNEEDINLLKVGDIIQFKRDNILITHRIIEIVNDSDGKLAFRTKGDNNSAADSRLVYPQEVRGSLVKVIPKLGYPTLLIKQRKNMNINEIEF